MDKQYIFGRAYILKPIFQEVKYRLCRQGSKEFKITLSLFLSRPGYQATLVRPASVHLSASTLPMFRAALISVVLYKCLVIRNSLVVAEVRTVSLLCRTVAVV